MKFKHLLAILISCTLFSTTPLKSQEMWVYDTATWIPVYGRVSLSSLDIPSCSYSDTISSTAIYFHGITILPDDEIYMVGIPFRGSSQSSGIFRRTYNSGLGLHFYAAIPATDSIQALTCDYNGLVYGAGKYVFVFDPADSTVTSLGDLPPGMAAGGDMAYHEGVFYLTTANNELVQLDMDNPLNSTIVATFPDSIDLIEGLATFPFRCDSIVTYAVATGETGSTIYHLDFDTYELTLVCNGIPRGVLDAATATECILPPCEIYADLDADDSSGDTLNNFLRYTCAAPVAIADGDTEVYSPFPIDSVKLNLIGTLDPGQEYLATTAAAGISIQGNGSPSLVLANEGGATETAFAEAIKNCLYHNDAAVPTFGNREVVITLYSSFYSSMPSLSTILLGDGFLQIEPDTAATSCFGTDDGTVLLNATLGQPPHAFLWPNGQTTPQRSGLSAGSYIITITDGLGCQNTDTLLITQPDSLAASVLPSTSFACGNTASLIGQAQGGTPPYAFSWSPGLPGDTLAGIGAGTYQLLATDANGCTASASFTLAGADSIFTAQEVPLCQGETFEWQGLPYTSDITLCQAYTSVEGCDSIHCVTLTMLDTFYAETQQSICWGEQLAWQGLVLDADTTVCRTYPAANGCDSTLCLQLEVIQRAGSLGAAICEGETYAFNGLLLNAPGEYLDTIPTPSGCDSLLRLHLEVYPLPELSILASGSLCTDSLVRLSAEEQGEYQWSTGAAAPAIEVSQAGDYSLTLTDARGCKAADTVRLSENDLQASFSLSPPRCAEESSGSIRIDSIWGGNEPYFIGLEGGGLQTGDAISELSVGSYTLLVEDAAGCRRSYGFSLQDPEPLYLLLPRDTTLQLGDSILLQPLTNAANPTVRWRPPDFLSCDTCLMPVARPWQSTIYQALLTDSLGCTATAGISVSVSKQSGIYVPNAFSPNEDGSNDRLAPYASASIVEIESFRVYNRWGGLLFERTGFKPNDESLGWDGTVSAQPAPPGLYVYQLIARRVDGEALRLEGEVLLVK